MLKCQQLLAFNNCWHLIVGILTFMSKINFMFSWVEHEKKFYNLGACSAAVSSCKDWTIKWGILWLPTGMPQRVTYPFFADVDYEISVALLPITFLEFDRKDHHSNLIKRILVVNFFKYFFLVCFCYIWPSTRCGGYISPSLIKC